METEVITLGKSRILIAPIRGEEEYRPYLTESDITHLNTVSSPTRRGSGAAWRAMTREYLGDINIYYNDVGAPIISGSKEHCFIGVSHSKQYVSVIISNERCAIDIEDIDRDFSKVTERYISNVEAVLPESSNPNFMCAMWCAKETVYKYSGLKGIDLLKDIKITSLDFVSNRIEGAFYETNSGWNNCSMSIIHYGNSLIIHSL